MEAIRAILKFWYLSKRSVYKMGILSFVPDLLDVAEKVMPGHGVELLLAMDTVATASFFLGVAVGVVGLVSVLMMLSAIKKNC